MVLTLSTGYVDYADGKLVCSVGRRGHGVQHHLTAKDSRDPTRWADQTSMLCVMKLAGCEPVELQEHAAEEKQIDKEEAARTLYVAATRERDLLVVCAVGDGSYDGIPLSIRPRSPASIQKRLSRKVVRGLVQTT